MKMEFLDLRRLPGDEGNVLITVGSSKPYYHFEFTLLRFDAQLVFNWLVGAVNDDLVLLKRDQREFSFGAHDSIDDERLYFELDFGEVILHWHIAYNSPEYENAIASGEKIFGPLG